VEYLDRFEYLRHWGGGTQVRQHTQTFNWFRLAVSAEIFFHTKHWWGFVFDAYNTVQEVYVTADLNENAVINHAHVWDGGERIAAFDGPDGRGLDIRGPNVSQTFNVPDRRVNFGIAVCA
jgi:hypothetical protein